MVPDKKNARIAGLLFLLMVVTGLFAELCFRQKIFTGDMAAMAENIASHGFLFRAGILSDIAMSVCYLFTSLALYRLLASVDKPLASVMVLFAAAGCVLLMSNILNELAPLYTATGEPGALSSGQLQALSMLSFTAYNHGYMIGQVFFALWVLPLGLLIIRSKFIPKVFGILFIIEVIGGLLSVVAHFLLPNATVESVLLLPGTAAEFAFLFWLLIRGVNEKKVSAQLA